MKRIWFDLILMVAITAIFLTHVYELAPPAMQLTLLKIILVSMGFIHAHVIGKIVFNVKLDWATPWEMASMAHVIRGIMYVAFPICYAIGG